MDQQTVSPLIDVPQARPASRRRRIPRLSIASLLWLCLLTAVLSLWYRDRVRLQQMVPAPAVQNTGPRWSTNQLLGPPDTVGPGDLSTAWASSTPDDYDEWLVLEFAEAIDVSSIEVHETFNPGALARIDAVSALGNESPLWEGVDPLAGVASGVAIINVRPAISTRRIKLHIASSQVPGWNEIDTVAIVDPKGTRHYPVAAWSSTCFGTNNDVPRWFWP
jgi:hypothetical protein